MGGSRREELTRTQCRDGLTPFGPLSAPLALNSQPRRRQRALVVMAVSRFLMNTFPTPPLRVDGSRWDHMMRMGWPISMV